MHQNTKYKTPLKLYKIKQALVALFDNLIDFWMEIQF